MQWALLLLLLQSTWRVESNTLGDYGGSDCPFFVNPSGSGKELLWFKGPCKDNPVCHSQCWEGSKIGMVNAKCPGQFIGYCDFTYYGSKAASLVVQSPSGGIVMACLGDNQPASLARLIGVPNTPGEAPRGDSFAGFTCYANGDTATGDSAVKSPNFFCQICTSMARQYHCSGLGIVQIGSAPKNAALGSATGYYSYDSTAQICLCDNQQVGYTDYTHQCGQKVRDKFCSGHGEAPANTNYRSNVAAADVTCVCDIGYAGPTCATFTGCPCNGGGCLVGERICACDTNSFGGAYCCPKYGGVNGRICNGHGTCMPGGNCACDDGWGGIDPQTGLVGCLPTRKGCSSTVFGACPLCQADTPSLLALPSTTGNEVLGTLNRATGQCDCYSASQSLTFKQVAFQNDHGSCNSYCPHTIGATQVQCAGRGKCLTLDGGSYQHGCTCDADLVHAVGNAAIVSYKVDSATGLCCPAYPLTARPGDIGFPDADTNGHNGYFVCGGRGSCDPTTGTCVWAAGRADPYGCPINSGQTTICNGQTCRVDGFCDCNTGSTNLAGPTCQLNVACNPSDTAQECKSGGTCTSYSATVARLVNDLGFWDETGTSVFGAVSIQDQGIVKLVERLYTIFAGYNSTHADFKKATFWQTWKTLCEGTVPLSHSACLEAIVTQFAGSNGVAQGRARFTTDSAYIQDVLKRHFPTQSFPGSTWQTAFSVGLSAGATNAQRLQSIVGLMTYNRLYDWNTGTPPTFAASYTVLCNCTAPAAFTPTTVAILWDQSNTRVGRGGLQCQGTCPVGRDGLVCSGIVSGVHRGHCLASGKCECDLLFTGPSCTINQTPCINTTIVPNQLCNGRPDAQCLLNAAGTAMQCQCPPQWGGQYCDITKCPVPASPTYAQTLIECSGYGTCSTPSLTCACDVVGQLAVLGGSATLTNKPRLPYGPACEFNGIDDCGTFQETNPVSHVGVWTECNQGHGKCVRSGSQGVCVCNGGFSGAKCTVQACAANCTATQVCNAALGQCQCRTMWSGTTCTTNRCVHGVPTSAGTACTCDALWSIDPSTGLCTIPACAPTVKDPVLGTQPCTGSEPICTSSAQYHSPGGCCRSVCTQCKYNASISAQPFCICGNSLLQTQSNGICYDRCNGGVATVINGAVDCDCTSVQNAIGNSRYVGNTATCGGIVSCLNNGVASGQSCACVDGFTGASCNIAPCGVNPASCYYPDPVHQPTSYECKWPFTQGMTISNSDSGGWTQFGAAGDPNKCNSNLCELPPSFFQRRLLAHGTLVRDNRPTSPDYVTFAGGLQLHQPGSGYACVCRDDEVCVGPDVYTAFTPVPDGLGWTPQYYNNQPCVGGCEPLDPEDRTGTQNALGYILAEHNTPMLPTSALFACNSLWGPLPLVGNGRLPPYVVMAKNHTLWCNLTTFDVEHRTGQFGYDYVCQNGGNLVRTAFVNGKCQCPYGTEFDLKRANPTYRNLVPYAATDNVTCACKISFNTSPRVVQSCSESNAGNPRLSDGVVVPGTPECGDGNQRCVCPFAYNGTYCELLRCQHGHASSDRSRCICNAGWSGSFCHIGTPGTETGIEGSSSSTGSASVNASSSSTAGSSNSTDAGVGRPTVASIGAAVAITSVGVVAAAGAAAVAGVNVMGTISSVLGIARGVASGAQAIAPLAAGQVTATTTTGAAAGVLNAVPI